MNKKTATILPAVSLRSPETCRGSGDSSNLSPGFNSRRTSKISRRKDEEDKVDKDEVALTNNCTEK